MKEPFFFTHPGRGLAAWIVITFVWWQPHPDEPRWIMPLLFFAALFLMPFSHALQRGASVTMTRDAKLEVFCAFMLVLSFAQDKVAWAVALTLPWLVWRAWWAMSSVQTLRHVQWTAGDLALASAGVFPVIGALWLTLHQTNRPLFGFDPLIVLLTAAHFHHAGFTLPLMAGLNAKATPNGLTKFSCVAILLGVPLVAMGITCTHFGVMPFVEPFGVTVLVLGAVGVAVSQIQRGLEKERKALARLGFVVSGVSLLAAMLLALGFGLRYLIPNLALTMPQMWAIHGTLNVFGFGLCGILAWRSVKR
ncbi:MAG TPA: hypothetical protein DDZ88_01825 [Verrucomicrobiales bacterium]|nr:hypothetical protein [Verrucomicrobiales bacterium]